MRLRSPLPVVAASALLLNLAAALASSSSHAEGRDRTPDCVVGGSGVRACGYDCISAYGTVRCAETPQGVCTQSSGAIACWDPPPIVRSVVEARQKRAGRPTTADVPRPQCASVGGKIACGYRCVTGFDQVQCAQTPWGICRVGEGTLACWDPPGAVLASYREGARIPDPTCSASYGQVQCGFQCAATNGQLACAQTPEGTCRAEQDHAFCFDAPLESRGVLYDPASLRACMQNNVSRACGHHCVANGDRVVCADNERGACLEAHGALACR